ncbi:flagellar FlbD family protein [Terriglobus saanensis]|uniref:Flagellar FlbD family protein n=1 Tax=Terriglobus saanensis (strain ATCC BAA-1853 / DSM 23119 / SP1PR4) TaxID=401053 RepID=E8UXK6_TERSS|nr:flagellar FlbD family protein [Terriglobus saanensis]ADV81950.1 flagellar FlbD family protein [Terriglobus saanensis SP1PR4]
MIELTRLNGQPISVNCDLMRYAESTPDTTITLVTGEKLVVLESREDLTQRVKQYRASILHEAWPSAASAVSALQTFRASSTE